MADENTVPQEGQTEGKSSTTPEGGKTEGQENAPLQSVPKNLEGKSQNDLIKMYGELERKIGEQGTELGQKRQFEKEMGVVLQAIYANPDVKSGVEKEMQKILGVEPKKNGETKGDESREVLEGQIIGGFLERKGLYALPQEEQAQAVNGIARELREMLDPSGKKTNEQIGKEIDLRNLPVYLEKAYTLANRDGEIQKAVKTGLAKAGVGRAGIIGGIQSSGNVNESETLSEDERHVAKRLGISEEDYLKNKKKL